MKISYKCAILQLSDLHKFSFHSHEENLRIIENLAEEVLGSLPDQSKLIVAICGDISDKGSSQGYNVSKTYLDKLFSKLRSKLVMEVIAVPGNHDICINDDNVFGGFNKLLFEIRKDSKIVFKRNSVVSIQVFENYFILINSSHKENHKKGSINLKELQKELTSHPNTEFILVHHHLIPTISGDDSVIENTYEFLKLIEYHNVKFILHGHQHMNLSLSIGTNNCKIIGVGSISSETSTNTLNQFNLHVKSDNDTYKSLCFKYEDDVIKNGRMGGFNKLEL